MKPKKPDPTSKVVALRRKSEEAIALTTARIESVKVRARRYRIADAKASGLVLQVEPSGAKAFYWRGAIGRGRAGRTQVMQRIGPYPDVPLSEARGTTLRWAAMARAGEDPRIDKSLVLGEALERYSAHLERRGYVRRKDVLSSLRRHLKPYLKRPLVNLTRSNVAAAMEHLEAKGRPGAAAYLRKGASSALAWAEAGGIIERNPLTGWRRPTATRAERLKTEASWTPVGKEALRRVWFACNAASDARFSVFLRLLLLLGLRRSELALLQWSDIDFDVGTLTVRAINAKTGSSRVQYLGPLSRPLLLELPHVENSRDLVFPGRGNGPMSGWSKRIAPVRVAAHEPVVLHGLRRAYRTGLSEMGVQTELAELMVGHARRGLLAVYDKSTLDEQRQNAQKRWEEHLRHEISP